MGSRLARAMRVSTFGFRGVRGVRVVPACAVARCYPNTRPVQCTPAAQPCSRRGQARTKLIAQLEQRMQAVGPDPETAHGIHAGSPAFGLPEGTADPGLRVWDDEVYHGSGMGGMVSPGRPHRPVPALLPGPRQCLHGRRLASVRGACRRGRAPPGERWVNRGAGPRSQAATRAYLIRRTSTLPCPIRASNAGCRTAAGPWCTPPSRGLNRERCHGHSASSSPPSEAFFLFCKSAVVDSGKCRRTRSNLAHRKVTWHAQC
jgi:hypothetical protein